MKRNPDIPGVTLIEVLIASGLFVLVLVLVGQLTVAAYWSHSQTTSKNQVMRDGSIALDRLNRELSMCTDLLLPDPAVPETDYQGTQPLVFRTYTSRANPLPESVLAYRFDSARKALERRVYEPSFDPADPVTQIPMGEPRIVAQKVVGFKYRIVAPALTGGTPFVRLQLELYGIDSVQPLGTATRVKSL
ncbi:MAG: hypothetical protein HY319_01395 [Armatimonadetes bacterium]|nr:hypothetical protein [Armatimonadota bacterium]